jgi:competence protein ComGC
MQKSAKSEKVGSRGFSLIDFLIIGGVVGILAFIIISNILARAY